MHARVRAFVRVRVCELGFAATRTPVSDMNRVHVL